MDEIDAADVGIEVMWRIDIDDLVAEVPALVDQRRGDHAVSQDALLMVDVL